MRLEWRPRQASTPMIVRPKQRNIAKPSPKLNPLASAGSTKLARNSRTVRVIRWAVILTGRGVYIAKRWDSD